MNKEQIIDAYCTIRKENHTIPDDVLNFMKESALKALLDTECDHKNTEKRYFDRKAYNEYCHECKILINTIYE